MRRCSDSGKIESGYAFVVERLEPLVVSWQPFVATPSTRVTSFWVSLTGHPATMFPAWFVYAFSANAENAYRRIIVETIDLPIISTVL